MQQQSNRRLRHYALPIAAAALLLVMPALLPITVIPDSDAALAKAHVAETIETSSRFIGPWTGIDVGVPTEAQKLLKPNATLSRTYRRPDGPQVHVLIVHCNDARDMIGHYPPVCYPSSGWLTVHGDEPAEVELIINGQNMPFHVYEFKRMRDHGAEDHNRIFDTFVLPDGKVTGNIDDISRQSERLAVATRGVAQVQIVTPASVDLDSARTAANELLAGLSDVFEALGVQQGVESAAHATTSGRMVRTGIRSAAGR